MNEQEFLSKYSPQASTASEGMSATDFLAKYSKKEESPSIGKRITGAVSSVAKYAEAPESTMVDDKSMQEAKAATVTGLASWIPAGYAMIAGAGMPEAPNEEPSLSKSAEISRGVQAGFTYEPKTEEGKRIANDVAKMTGIPQVAEMGYQSQEQWYKWGDEAQTKGDTKTAAFYRAMGLAAGVGGEAAPFIVGGVMKPIVRGGKLTADAFLNKFKPKEKPSLVAPLNKKEALASSVEKESAPEEARGVGAKAPGATGETPSDLVQLTESLEGVQSPKLSLPHRIANATKLSDRVSVAKDTLGKGIDRLKAVGETLYDDVKTGELGKPKPYKDFDRIRDEYVGAYQVSNYEARRFGSQIRNQISDPTRREAITNYIQADGDLDLLKKQAEQSAANPKTKRYTEGYEAARELTESERVYADNQKNYFEAKLAKGIEADLLEHGLEDYVNMVFEKESPIKTKLKADIAGGRLPTNPSFLKKRLNEDYFMAEQQGYVPKSKDIGYLATAYDQSFNKALAARNFIKKLHETDASDGRPLVSTSGAGKQVEGQGATDSAYLIRPRAKTGETGDYRIIDHPALRKWKWVSADEAGNPILNQGDLLVHPEYFEKLNNMLKTSAIRKNPVGKIVLTGIANMKGLLLSLSGFHQTQVGLHAIFHGVNPFNTPKIDLADPVQRSLVDHGVIVADYKNMELFHEGITSGGIIGKIPGIGELTHKYTDWLFTDYIPRLKMKMAMEAYNRNTKRYQGKLSDDQVKSITADQANAAFGELNYAKLGRDPTLQDALRLMLLAPDFFEARARFVSQALRPYAGIPNLLKSPTMNEQGMAAVLRGGIGLYVGARIVNAILNDGDTHTDKPFSVIIKGDEFTLRSDQLIAKPSVSILTPHGPDDGVKSRLDTRMASTDRGSFW